MSDLKGVLEFQRRHPRYRPLLVADSEAMATARRAGIAAMPWREFLLGGP